ncbi:MAG TPA: hypothetical protein VI997_08835 [Candidatus Thermoplasmatota archaeon]|nr:hypothetical protein [Candidatus Thermoplasmatota archaeon]
MLVGWKIGLAASTVISIAFLAVAVLLALNLTRSRTWRTNPLGVGTFGLYLTCGGGHAVHTLQLLDPVLGLQTAAGLAAHTEYSEWHAWGIDVVTAITGVWYWSMRRKFPDLVSGAAVFEDLRDRQRRALEIHDNVVQGLVRAKLELDLGRDEAGDVTVEETLEKSKLIITDLLGEEQDLAGKLRRTEAGR